LGMVKNGILEDWLNDPNIKESDIKLRIKQLMYHLDGSVSVQATKLAGQTKAMFTDKVKIVEPIPPEELQGRIDRLKGLLSVNVN